MARKLMIDRAIYLVDDVNKRYRFLRRNPDWEKLGPGRNNRNKKHIDGYTRIFSDGRTKTFHYKTKVT